MAGAMSTIITESELLGKGVLTLPRGNDSEKVRPRSVHPSVSTTVVISPCDERRYIDFTREVAAVFTGLHTLGSTASKKRRYRTKDWENLRRVQKVENSSHRYSVITCSTQGLGDAYGSDLGAQTAADQSDGLKPAIAGSPPYG